MKINKLLESKKSNEIEVTQVDYPVRGKYKFKVLYRGKDYTCYVSPSQSSMDTVVEGDGKSVNSKVVTDSNLASRIILACYQEKQKSIKEDTSYEWKPNTSFKHIKDIYEKVKANGYKYVNNEREEFMAAVKKAEAKGYKPEQRRQIRDWHRDIWAHNRKTESYEGTYSDKFRNLIKKYEDEGTSSSGIINDIIRYCPEDALKDLWYDRGYARDFDKDELTEGSRISSVEPKSINEEMSRDDMLKAITTATSHRQLRSVYDKDSLDKYVYECGADSIEELDTAEIKEFYNKIRDYLRKYESDMPFNLLDMFDLIDDNGNLKESIETLWQKGNQSIIKDGYGFGIDNGYNVNRFTIDNDGKVRYDNPPSKTMKAIVDRLVRQGKFNNPNYSDNAKYVGNTLKYGRGVKESFEKEGGPFWYFTKHGLGPGMLPKGVNVVDTKEDDNYGTYIALDKVLTTQELREYELVEKKPSMEEAFKPTESGIQSVKCYNRYNYTIQELRVDNDKKTFERGQFTAGKPDKKTKNRQEFEDIVDTLKELGYTEIKSDYRSMRNKSRKGELTEGIEVATIADYITDHYEFDDDTDDLSYYYDDELFNDNLENSPYTEIASKSVPDFDGFMTDYTMYMNINTGEYVFILGDKDIYTPEDGNFDWECETEEEAREWFDSYNGYDDIDESIMNESDAQESPIIHKKSDGSYLVVASNGDGYVAFNKSDVCMGNISANNETEAKNKFNVNKFDE